MERKPNSTAMPIQYGISHDDYLKIPALNASFLKKMIGRTAAHAKHEQDHPSDPTESMRLGTIEHALLLEPENWKTKFHIEAERINRNKKAGKRQEVKVRRIEKWCKRTVVYDPEVRMASAMAAKVRNNPEACKWLDTAGNSEVTLTVDLEWMGAKIPCKCRFDKLTKSGYIVDVKTTLDASETGFIRAIEKYGYYIQVPWYIGLAQRAGIEIKGFKFLTIESHSPYASAVYDLDANYISDGRNDITRALDLYVACKQDSKWPGYHTNCKTISRPAWAKQRANQNLPTDEDNGD